DDHRLRLVRRDQVVEDEAGAAHRAPRVVDVAGAVQQVEHRIAIAARVVAGRRVDMRTADGPGRGGVVVDRRGRTVRNVLRVENIRAGYDREAVHRRVRLARRRIARVDDGDAIDVEDVAIRAGWERTERPLPHALTVPGQLRRLDAAAADARNVAR